MENATPPLVFWTKAVSDAEAKGPVSGAGRRIPVPLCKRGTSRADGDGSRIVHSLPVDGASGERSIVIGAAVQVSCPWLVGESEIGVVGQFSGFARSSETVYRQPSWFAVSQEERSPGAAFFSGSSGNFRGLS